MSSFSSDRDSRFEALRLIGIYFIILTHASAFGIRNVVGAILPNDMRISLILNYLLNFPGTFFNAVFVIVTGYFCIIRDVSYKRILVLAFQLCFYSWAVALLALLAGIVTENRWSVAGQALFSLFNGYNWFINCYIFFSLFIPILNKMIRALDKNSFRTLILLLVTYRCLYTVLGIATFIPIGKDISYFLLFYLIGAWLRLNPFRIKSARCFVSLIIVFFFYGLSVTCFGMIYKHTGRQWFFDHITLFLEPAKIASSILAFKLFESFKPFINRKINWLAGSVAGVYILHENRIIRPLIWQEIWPLAPFLDSWSFLPLMLFKSLIVMLVCLAAELPWRLLVFPFATRMVERICRSRS